ncbi:SusE domain-containing protein [Flavobacterium sp.]|uniref:SusE domain-containing protein n=1 Tax=Flavobacterium sp. TaxID=239 RepID=UPI0040470F1F
MKNIVKSFLSIALVASLVSCEDEQNLMFLTPEGSFEILTPTSGDEVVLDATTPLNPGLTLSWEDANYGSTPTEITYEVEIDKTGDDFDTPLVITSTTNTYVTTTSDVLNSAVVAVGLTPFTQGSIDIRIKASVGAQSSEVQYSNVINYLVTPYSTDLPKLSVPGNHQGWNPPTAPRIAASAFGETDYEGYVWLDGGFKFVAPDATGNFNWGNTDYGDDGTFSGVLVETGESDCTATVGYYRVRANPTAGTWSADPVSWGIIGAATPTGWGSDTDLVYNPTTQKLEIASIALVPGAFKFRGNNDWSNGFDLGTVNADGYLVDGGDLTFDGAAGNYKVILDLSNPRKYTYELIAL